MKEKYILITSYVSYETKTSVTTSPVFNTAIEALLHLKKVKALESEHASEKSYSFYELCHWAGIDSTQLYGKSLLDMEAIARIEAEALLNPIPEFPVAPENFVENSKPNA
jgi:hypothetical protein